jgi:hypothetical protein
MVESPRDRLIAGIGDAAKHGEISADGNGVPRMSGDSWYVLKKRIDTALAEAEARGRRQGLEKAAKVATGHADAMEGNPPTSGERVASRIAVDILALRATAPAETQKPETGESDHA